MARNQHTFAKRQREQEKKRKAAEKRERRLSRKGPDAEPSSTSPAGEEGPATAERDPQTSPQADLHDHNGS